MEKHRVTIEVEVHDHDVESQLFNAVRNVMLSWDVVNGKKQQVKNQTCPFQKVWAKKVKVRQPKPQALTAEKLHDIHEKVHGFRDNNSNTGWCSGSHVPRGRWAEVKDFQDAWERSPKFAHQAKGVEAVLRRECDTREKLMRYRKYWRVKGINPRGLDYTMLLLAMSNAIAREHNERHYLFSDVKDRWSI